MNKDAKKPADAKPAAAPQKGHDSSKAGPGANANPQKNAPKPGGAK